MVRFQYNKMIKKTSKIENCKTCPENIEGLKIPAKRGGFTRTPKNFGVSLQSKRGFTLIELIVAITLFTVITTFALGSVLAIFDANRRARSMRTVVDNLNFSIESMARNIRFGTNYYCGTSSNLNSTNDCSINGANHLSVTFEGLRYIYGWQGGANDPIRRSINGGTTYTNITSPETKIQDLKFYVFGSTPSSSGDNNQPRVLVIIRGYVGNKPTAQSTFNIQTLMSQRKLDI